MELPDYYLPIMPYIIVDDSAAFLAYTKRVFGATELMIVPDDKDPSKIMHGELKIQDAVIMFANSTETWKEKTSGMFLIVEDVDRIYNAGVEQGGLSIQAPQKKEYGYSAGLQDPFGNHWWLTQRG